MRFIYIPREKKVEMFASSGDTDQMPRSAVSDLGLHCLPITLLRVSRLQWVKENTTLSPELYRFIYMYFYFKEMVF